MCLEEPKEVRGVELTLEEEPKGGGGEERKTRCPSLPPLQELRLEISHLEEQLSQIHKGPDE